MADLHRGVAPGGSGQRHGHARPTSRLSRRSALLLFGNASAAVSVLLLAAVPLAGLTAYLALRRVTSSPVLRIWGATTYALLPRGARSGRVGTDRHRHPRGPAADRCGGRLACAARRRRRTSARGLDRWLAARGDVGLRAGGLSRRPRARAGRRCLTAAAPARPDPAARAAGHATRAAAAVAARAGPPSAAAPARRRPGPAGPGRPGTASACRLPPASRRAGHVPARVLRRPGAGRAGGAAASRPPAAGRGRLGHRPRRHRRWHRAEPHPPRRAGSGRPRWPRGPGRRR